MNEMKSITLNGKKYDSFVDAEARKAIEDLEQNGVTDEQIEQAVSDYMEENPVETPEVDLTGYVKSVNGNTPDENGNVEIPVPDSSQNVTGVGITSIVALTQAQYDALEEKCASTIYIITDATSDDTGENPGDDSGSDMPTNMIPYLLNDGNCIVDTGYVFEPGDIFELTYRIAEDGISEWSKSENYIGGGKFSASYAGSGWISTYHSDIYIGYKPADINKKTTIKRELTKMYYDGEVVGEKTGTAIKGTANAFIYGTSSTKICTHIWYFYGLKIWNGENLVHDYQPKQDSEGIACIYDAVTKKYLYNSGTGAFAYGTELEES